MNFENNIQPCWTDAFWGCLLHFSAKKHSWIQCMFTAVFCMAILPMVGKQQWPESTSTAHWQVYFINTFTARKENKDWLLQNHTLANNSIIWNCSRTIAAVVRRRHKRSLPKIYSKHLWSRGVYENHFIDMNFSRQIKEHVVILGRFHTARLTSLACSLVIRCKDLGMVEICKKEYINQKSICKKI